MKGDKKVIEYLNAALRSELTAVSQYWLHYRLQEDWGYGRLASKSREESIEEMNHADKLIERIIFLEGHPNLQKLDPLHPLLQRRLQASLAGSWHRKLHVLLSGKRQMMANAHSKHCSIDEVSLRSSREC